jgi:K319L-like, PKD domain/PKD domain/Calx-beta domain
MMRKVSAALLLGLLMASAGLVSVVLGQAAKRPTAIAGPNQTIDYIGIVVHLDGSASISPTGAPLAFRWTFSSTPAGSAATLAGADTSAPTFVPDRPGRYRVQLVVDNGVQSNADFVTITVNNRAPTAAAGPDRAALSGQTVVLDGSASSDPDADPLTYRWRLDSRPPGSHAKLIAPTSVRATFVVDRPGTYAARLTVDDGQTTASDSVVINVPNSAPTANAGPDQSAAVGASVRLDGSRSSDPDGDRLRFSWAFVSIPAGSTAQLSNRRSVTPTFVVDRLGQYVVALTVNDGTVDSVVDTVTISTENTAPVANAGADQTAVVNQLIHLDGSGSSDVDGNALTFVWSFVQRPAGSIAALSDPTALRPTFTVDRRGTYRVQLVVNDGLVNSDPDFIDVVVGNSAPTAAAGPDQRVSLGSVVTLDGSGSTDVDGDTLVYMWSLTSVPSGSTAALNDTSAVKPTFTADAPGTYVAQLIVSDGIVASAPDTVMIVTGNVAPVANAGPAQTVHAGQLVQLNGTGSYDVDGDPLTYQWSLTVRPSGSGASLTGATTATPSFTADQPGDYVAQLIVNDGSLSSAPSTVMITTQNSTPEANAGADQIAVAIGSTVHLDGSLSSDADGDALSYHWSLLSRPADSAAALDSPTSSTPSFVLDVAGDYVAQLIVNDGFSNSPPDTVFIQSEIVLPQVTIAATDAAASEAGLDPGTFTVTRTGATTSDLTVFLSISGSATNGTDYTALNSSVVIPNGASSALITITPIDDTLDEGNESVVIALSADPAYTIGAPAQDTVVVSDNDGRVVTALATVADASEAGPAPGTITFTRTGDTSGPLSLNIVRGGTATESDYTGTAAGPSFVVTIPSGKASIDVAITPTADALVEGSETVALTIGSGIDYTVGDPAAATVTIADDPPVVTLVASDSDASEAGPDPGTFTIQRSGGSLANALTVNYIIGGTATNGTDYSAIGATVTIPTGQSAAAITITPINDGIPEGEENVSLTLSASPSYVVGVSNAASVTIHDATAVTLVSVTAIDASASESGSDPGVFRLARTGSAAAALTVGYSIAGTATNGVDYTTISGTIVIPAAQAFADLTIAPIPDGVVEGSETVIVTVLDTADYDVGTPASATVTIGDTTDPCAGGGGALINGATHCGTIGFAGETDTWTFDATLGDRIAVHVGEVTDNNDFRPRIRLIAPNGASLGDTVGVAATAINGAVAPATGTYQILISSYDSFLDGTGTYRLTMAHTPGPITISAGDEGGPMVNGAMHTGAIVPGDLDVWTFAANAGERIALHIGEITDTADFHPWIRLWAPNGTILADTAGVDAAAVNGAVAPVTGTYLVLVASYDSGLDGAGTYRLSVVHQAAVTVSVGDEGGPLTNGANHTGQIVTGDVDVWTFNANAGDRIGVSLAETSDNNGFRPWLRLWAPNGTILGDTAGDVATVLNGVVAPVAGTYYVLVASYDSFFDGTGTYRLTMTHTPGPITISSGDEGGPVVNGATHTGTINVGDLDVWTFNASAGERIAVHIGEVTDDNDFRPWIRLWAPNGAVLADTAGVDAAVINGAVAPVAGTYLVLVASYDSGYDGTGTYRMTVAHTPGTLTVSSGDDGGPLTNGAMHTGRIDRGDLDVWTFDATAGDRIGLHVGQITDENDFRPWLRLWAANGTVLADTAGVTAAVVNGAVAPVTGTYYVLVASYDSAYDGTGTYRLTMTHTPGPITVSGGDEGGPLTNGATHSGTIQLGDVDVWTFTANAGERIAMNIGEIVDNDDFRPWIRLWAPNGAVLADTAGVAATVINGAVAPVTGTYLVLVSSYDSGFDGTGTYQLTVAHTPGPVSISAGDEGGDLTNGGLVTGAITVGDLDVWTVSVVAGQHISINISEVTDTADFHPWIRLWAPNGAVLGDTAGVSSAAITNVVAPTSGTYFVLVSSYDSGFDGTGTYQMTVIH